MNTPSVSIVTPTYNCAAMLRRAIESVRQQTWQDWEMLVVDNHSEDDTAAVVARFNEPRIRYLRIHNHGIIAKSRNLALSEAKGMWVAFLDADDWWAPCKLALSVQALQQGADVVYHDLIVQGPGARWLRHRIRSRSLRSPVFHDLVLHGNALPNSSVMALRALVQQAGGLSEDPSLVAAEDFDCWLRLSRLTESFFRLPGAHGYYWIGSNNNTNPQRAVSTLTELRKRFVDNEDITKIPDWIAYALAKAHFQLGEVDATRRELAKIQNLGATPLILLKKLVLQLMLTRY